MIFKNWFNHLVCLLAMGSVIAYFPFPPHLMGKVDPTQQSYLAKEMFAKYSMVLIACFCVFLKMRRIPNLKILASFLIYLILSSSVYGFEMKARIALANIFVAIAFYGAVAGFFDYSKLRIVGYWMLGIFSVNALWMALQYFCVDPIFMRNDLPDITRVTVAERCVGFLQLKANNGIFGAMSASLLLLIHPALALITLPVVFLGNSSSSVMAMFLSLSMIAFIRMKRTFRVLAAVSLIAIGSFYVLKFDMPHGQFQERFKVWHEATGVVLKNNPIFGVGLGSFSNFDFQTKQGEGLENLSWAWAHNEYIQCLFESGLLGILFVVFFLIGQVKDFILFYRDKDLQILFAGFLCVAMVSFFNFPFHVGKFSMFFVFIMALFHGKVCELKKNRDLLSNYEFSERESEYAQCLS